MDYNTFLKNDYDALVKASNKITGNNKLSFDLLHYAIEEMSYKSNLQDILDSGGARFYCVCIMTTQWRSKTGPFYKTYVKKNESIEDIDIPEVEEQELDTKKVNQLLDELNWYDKDLFKLFAEGDYNFSTLSKATGIPRTSIGLTINRVRKYLKKNI